MPVAGTDLQGPTVPYPDHGARSLFTANNGEAGLSMAIEVLSGSPVPNALDTTGRNGRFSSVWLLLVNKIHLYLSFNDAADNTVETRCLQQTAANYDLLAFQSLPYLTKQTDASKQILIFAANTKAGQGVVDADGTSISFVGKQGVLFGLPIAGTTKSCMSADPQVLDLFTVKRNATSLAASAGDFPITLNEYEGLKMTIADNRVQLGASKGNDAALIEEHTNPAESQDH